MVILISQPKFQRTVLFVVCTLLLVYILKQQHQVPYRTTWIGGYVSSSFDWAARRPRYPQTEITQLPRGDPRELPPIQHVFSLDDLSEIHNKTQTERRDAVKDAAIKSWTAYSEYAWGKDQLMPQSLRGTNSFNGWGATLVDSLDTLWIMGLTKEFKEAVRMVAKIDWDRTSSEDCSLFETNIRYLGGLLSAYDLSQEKVLLKKAVELGEMLYAAFDTPNHLPANMLDFRAVKEGMLVANKREASAAVGTLSLEFTRLSQLTRDPKFFSAVDNIKRHFERTQDDTKLPGMWPIYVDLKSSFHTEDTGFSLGAMADSAYEYLSKMYGLLGGLDETYKTLHVKAMATIREHLLFRPMLPDTYAASPPDILFSGTVLSNTRIIELVPEVSHLGCFAGGMFALGGRLFRDDEHVRIGEQLARGCAWAYDVFPTGIMPEMADMLPCPKKDDLAPCTWNETEWRERSKGETKPPLKPYYSIRDQQYLLRPEAIESIFVLYRITGKEDLLDVAWRMFQSIKTATETKAAFSAIMDVQAEGDTNKLDAMESYWMAETLKYFYLIFSGPEVISLDDYVFNTEGHPLRLPKPGKQD